MREIYKTEGIILGNFPLRESGKSFLILSPDLGLFYAYTDGVRSLKSRLRYALQDLSLVSLDLVLGRFGWKITNVGLIKSWYFTLRHKRIFLEKVGKIKKLLSRMTEENQDIGEVFKIFNLVFDFYSRTEILNDEESALSMELYLNAKILNLLGYIDYKNFTSGILDKDEIDTELLKYVFQNKKFISGTINKAIKESQM